MLFLTFVFTGQLVAGTVTRHEPMKVVSSVVLNKTNFPDATFRAYISSITGVAEGGTLTDEILQSEKIIDVSGSSNSVGNITSLKGIEYFTALTTLYCSYNQLMSLDVSNNTALTTLQCDLNQLTSLDVSKNTALTTLNCPNNKLTSLEVSKNTALTNLYCDCNQLTSLDVSKNTALTYLSCGYNQLTSLDVSKNTALTNLYCDCNQLTSLDVSKNTALTYLSCGSNQLTRLDVSKNTALTYLSCGSNQLTSLDVSKNTVLTRMYCDNNQLTSLDVTKNTVLKKLYCPNNKLTSLEVSKNTALTSLSCYSNQLMSLDASKCDKLESTFTRISSQSINLTATKTGTNQYMIAVPEGFNLSKVSEFKADGVSITPTLAYGFLAFSSSLAPSQITYLYDSDNAVAGKMDVTVTITEVVETDKPNTAYMDDMEVLAGTDAVLSIKMKNVVPMEGFEFDLYLPEGVTVAVDEDGFPEVSLSLERTTARKTNSFDAVIREDGSIRVLAASTNGSAISGNDGEIVTVKVSIADDMIEGDYLVLLKNIALSGTDAKSYTNDMMVSTLTVNSYILGDANRDTQVNVGDFTATAHHILGNTPTQFNSKAADANQDYRIDVGDLTAIAHLILYGSVNIPNHAPSPRHLAASMTEAENTDNYVYIDPFNASTGAEYVVAVNMKNEVEAEGFEFDMYLPDGMSFVLDEDGFPEASLSTERTTARKTNNFDAVIQPDGALRVLAASSNGSSISGNDGEVALVKIKIDESLAAGTYTLQLKNIVISDVDAVSHYTEERDAYATVVQGVATGVDGFDADAPTAGYYYNLNGQLVRRNATTDGLPAGVYIVNGKKVVVK